MAEPTQLDPAAVLDKNACGQEILQKLSLITPTAYEEFLSLYDKAQCVKQEVGSEKIDRVFVHAGRLVSLPEAMAESVVQFVTGRTKRVSMSQTWRASQVKNMRRIKDALKRQPVEYVDKVVQVWMNVSALRDQQEYTWSFRDLGYMMQFEVNIREEVFRRVARTMEFKKAEEKKEEAEKKKKEELEKKKKGKEERKDKEKESKDKTSPTAPTPPQTSTKKYPKSTPRQANPKGLGHLSVSSTYPQANKRKHSRRAKGSSKAHEANPSRPQRPKREYKPWVGDWKCSLCTWWNTAINNGRCVGRVARPDGGDGRRDFCEGMRDTHAEVVQEDDGQHSKYLAESDYVGDWLCGKCSKWKPVYTDECWRCGYSKSGCCIQIIKAGPGKVVRPDVYIDHRKPGFC